MQTFEKREMLAGDLAAIEGSAFIDANNNGALDVAEGRLQNVLVSLFLDDVNPNGQVDPGETLVGTFTTGPEGTYRFENLDGADVDVPSTAVATDDGLYVLSFTAGVGGVQDSTGVPLVGVALPSDTGVLISDDSGVQVALIDDFSVGQSGLPVTLTGLSVGIGQNSPALNSGGTIIGDSRDFDFNRLTTPGTAFFDVVGGIATLIGTGGSEHQLELIYDGVDTSFPIVPDGLGGVDLSDNAVAGLLMQVQSDALVTSGLQIEVFTDADNSSSIVTDVPNTSGAFSTIFLPFVAFTVANGTGADFSNVGAVRVNLNTTGSPDASILIDLIETRRDNVTTVLAPAVADGVIGVVVTTLTDELDFTNTDVSLREAIASVNSGIGVESITFAPELFSGGAASIGLTLDELQITESVTINGPGPTLLTLDAQQASRHFDITLEAGDVSLSGMTLTGGRGGVIQHGGAIRSLSSGTLTISNSTITGNSVSVAAGNSAYGGAVFVGNGNLTITKSTLSDNSAVYGGAIYASGDSDVTITGSTVSGNRSSDDGGAIYAGFNGQGDVTVTNSTVSGNESGDRAGAILADNITITSSTISGNLAFNDGGGIVAYENLSVIDSTISGNTATNGNGGGISAPNPGNIAITNSTLSGNRVLGTPTFGGGAVYFDDGDVTITNSTITGNSANLGGAIGINADYSGESLTIRNSIIAGNTATTNPDFTAPGTPATNLVVAFSIIGDNSGTTLAEAAAADANGNLIGTTAALIDPKLGPLAFNGGTTQTHAFLGDSPAINAGSDALVIVGQTNDQRGVPFVRQSDVVDMGAYELQTLDPSFFIVTTLDDELDYSNTAVSLREAINSANGSVGTDTITFNPSLFTSGAASIVLTLGELQVTESATIDGPSQILLTIDANQQSRVLNIFGGTEINVGLLGMTITGGLTTGDNLPEETIHSGGGIRFMSSGSLTITESALSFNGTRGIGALGGGIFAPSGNVVLQGSTVYGNSTSGFSAVGGGILTNSGNVTLTGSTLSGNRTTGDVAFGGGISTQTGNVTLNRSTLSRNYTTGISGTGGGIYSFSGSITLTSSTVSGNSTAGDSSIGGGIFAVSASVTLTDSSITNNSTGGDSSSGGGVFAATGNVTLNSSTVSGNRTAGTTSRGGGIYARSGNVTLTGSTLSGNQVTGATSDGGGIWFDNSIVTILNSTITANTASGAGGGLGMRANPTDKKLTIHNTIVAGNTAASDADFTAPTTPATNLEVKSSLIGNNAGTTLAAASTADANGNLIGTPAALIDPKLGPLAFNGGTTQTHALLADSPAINAGDDSLVVGLINDQRGAPFVRKNGVVDIGAYELKTLDPSFFVVTTLDDELDYSNTAVSLREAIIGANGNVGTDMITFAEDLFAGGPASIVLTMGELPITDSLTVAGPGQELLSIDANQQSRVLGVIGGTQINVTLEGLTLTGGRATGENQFIDGTIESSHSGGGIRFDSSGTLTLTSSTISKNSSAAGNTFFAAFGGGIFATSGAVTLTGSTVSGNSSVSGGGGGIYANSGAVTLTDSTVSGNSTGANYGGGAGILSRSGAITLTGSTVIGNSTAGEGARGGGIYSSTGAITLTSSTVSGNSTAGDNATGGGIYSSTGAITLTSSSVSGNSTAGDNARGGGIYSSTGAITLTSSTVSGNSTEGDSSRGGGIYANLATVTLTNSTVSGNRVTGTDSDGGGIGVYNSVLTVVNSTITANSAARAGGGISVNARDSDKKLTIHNTIIAGNTAASAPDFTAPPTPATNLEVRFSLIGNIAGTSLTLPAANGNLIGTATAPLDPKLGPLATNGGLTQTHALLADSPAINKGSDALVDSTQINDQRGAPFGRKNGVVDMGAYELRTLDPSFFVVTTLNDELDYSNTAVSLREAIISANGNIGTDTITFNPSLFTSGAASIVLTRGELPVTESIVIDGPGQDLLTIDANQLSRVMNILGGTAIDVSLEGLTLTGGRTTGDNQLVNGARETTHSGGGIRFDSTGTLTLAGSTVSGNSTTGTYARGGGIFTLSGAVTLTSSTVSGNSTTSRESSGGGIHSPFGNVKLTDSTISGNSTAGSRSGGGGLYTRYGNAEITRSTISGNSTSGGNLSYGGGIHMDSGALVMNESTVSNNSTTGNGAFGGGIRTNDGTVTLSGTTVSDNFTTGGDASGGGIFTLRGAVTLADSVVSGNRTTGREADGGGIYSIEGAVTMTNSTISGNSTTGDFAGGGGVYARNGALTLTRSTVSGNRTSGRYSYGGGIYSNYNGATLTLIGSTISGNQVTGTDSDGGGVGFNNSVVTILNSTITGNSATRAGGGLGTFGNRFDEKLTIHNSIIAGNTAASNPDFTAPNDPANNLEVRFSLIGNNAGTSLTLPATGGNLIGTATTPLDPKLGPLVSGGGPTQTHALLPGSPALDAADQTLLPAGVTTDQRGVTRVIDLLNITNPTGKTGLDIGAVEMIGVSIANATANESAATIDFMVTLSHAIPSGSSVSVDFSTADIAGQAIAGTDYTALNQRIVFVGGGALTATVAVPLLNDSLDESNETFAAAITSVTGAIITQGSAIGTIIDDDGPTDFGDAPAIYPVTLAQDGARHIVGPLFLGEIVDADVNGTPSVNADSDDGDDGVFVLSTFITTNVATTSSFSVTASQAGKLDAWIDFNNDGDWSDAGEQIFTSANVVAGENLLSFTIPAGATSGSTGARFRLSTTGALAPTGAAVDGEVEDYLASIVTGAANALLEIDVPAAPAGNASLVVEGTDLIVRKDDVVLFRAPFASFGELNLNGSPLDDVLQLTILESLATKTLVFDGGLGKDFLELVEAGRTLDLTAANVTIREIEGIDIRGTGNNRLVISIDRVKAASSTTDTLEVVSNVGDTITFGPGWKAETPRFIDGQFTHIISESATAGTARVEVRNDRFFTNPLNRFDVDRNGSIQPLDALRVINSLRRLGSGPLALPTNDSEISSVYLDVSSDNDLTALDALRVINAISRINRGIEPEGESSLVDIDVFAKNIPDSNEVIDMAISEFKVRKLAASFEPAQRTKPSTASIDEWMEELGADSSNVSSALENESLDFPRST